jgi:putative tryptophan/tyrosine transport system substrate-binding protein
LVRLKVDVIVTAATPAALAAKAATSTIPVVMVDPGDPVATKLVASLARPGGNLTGLSSATPDLAAKHLELMKEALPRLTHTGFLWNAATPAGALALTEMQAVAPRLGIDVASIQVKSVAELQAVVESLPRNLGGLIVFTDPLAFTHRQHIVDAALKARIPVLSGSKEFADVGALLFYGPSFPQMFRPSGRIRRQDSEGRQARRSSRRAAHQVRDGHQPQDRPGARPHDPTVACPPRRPRHPVMKRRA